MTSRLFYHKETGAPVQIIARAQTKPTYQEVICYQELTKPYDHFVMEKRQFFAEYVKEFAELMNEKAAELGLTNTHFVTPHGLEENRLKKEKICRISSQEFPREKLWMEGR